MRSPLIPVFLAVGAGLFWSLPSARAQLVMSIETEGDDTINVLLRNPENTKPATKEQLKRDASFHTDVTVVEVLKALSDGSGVIVKVRGKVGQAIDFAGGMSSVAGLPGTRLDISSTKGEFVYAGARWKPAGKETAVIVCIPEGIVAINIDRLAATAQTTDKQAAAEGDEATKPDQPKPKDATVVLEVPSSNRVKWSGPQKASDGVFVPVQVGFEVTGGELVSTLGKIEKRAQFTSWSYVYSDEKRNKVVGWGPCVTGGEVIVPRIQGQEVPKDRFVENSFQAEDLDKHHTLIRLDPKKNHRLCILYQEPTGGAVFIGGFTKFANTQAGGVVSVGPDPEAFFISTAGYLGTTAIVHGRATVRQTNGWVQR